LGVGGIAGGVDDKTQKRGLGPGQPIGENKYVRRKDEILSLLNDTKNRSRRECPMARNKEVTPAVATEVIISIISIPHSEQSMETRCLPFLLKPYLYSANLSREHQFAANITREQTSPPTERGAQPYQPLRSHVPPLPPDRGSSRDDLSCWSALPATLSHCSPQNLFLPLPWA
jgi:hypothetical protein